MKRISATIIIMTVLSGIVFTQTEKIKLSVSPFDDTVTSAGEREQAGSGFSARLESAFSEVERFYVRPADAIRGYINKLEKVQVGLANADSIAGVSDRLQVDYLTVGTISKFDDRYEVDARTVDITDWSIVHAYGCTAGSMNNAIEDVEWYITEQFTFPYLKERKNGSEDLPTVSVFRFIDGNRRAVHAGYSGAFSEILNSQLGSYTGIVTIERKYSRALIEEQTLEMLGVVENNDSDKALKIKGIGYKMEGDIRVFDDVITLNYKLYDTTSGHIVYMGSRDITTPSVLRSAARVIANTVDDVLNNRVGTLKITSKPSKAEVYIDGRIMGTTPLVVSADKGSHSMEIKLKNYETHEQSIDVSPRMVSDAHVVLKREYKEYKPGDRGPGGGFVFYDKGKYSNGWRYLEASPVHLGKAEWGCKGTEIGGTRKGIGRGRANTRAIIKGCGEKGIAAKVAAAYRGGGKKDWFLPSADELYKVKVNLVNAGIISTDYIDDKKDGVYPHSVYWSSYEEGAADANQQNIGISAIADIGKDLRNSIIAVRAF